MWPVAIAGVAGLAGSLLGNRAQKGEAKRNRAFESAEAQKSRTFSERMRNTEWQAGIEDMKAAGLNPALAYSQGGASAPMGAQGSGSQAQLDDPLSSGISNALQARMQSQQMKLIDQQVSKTRAETLKARADATISRREADMKTGEWSYYFTDQGRSKPALMDLLNSTHAGRMATNARSVAETQLAELTLPERKAMASLFESIGGGGAAARTFMPLLMELLRGRK